MTAVDRATATAFAIAVNRIRPAWESNGIRAMIERGTPRQATLSQVLIAAVTMAENGSVQRPSADVFRDGPWWDRSTPDHKRPEWAGKRVTCPLHPHHPLGTDNCPECQKDAGDRLTPEQIAANAAECKRLADEARKQAAAQRRVITTARQEAQA